jgi:hypothetical protein
VDKTTTIQESTVNNVEEAKGSVSCEQGEVASGEVVNVLGEENKLYIKPDKISKLLGNTIDYSTTVRLFVQKKIIS